MRTTVNDPSQLANNLKFYSPMISICSLDVYQTSHLSSNVSNICPTLGFIFSSQNGTD
jgi:hypothetical protein